MIRRVVNIKQSLAVVAVAAMSLCWSCSKDSDSVDGAAQLSEGGDISFGVTNAVIGESSSRASVTNDIASFGVYATSSTRTDGLIFTNQAVEKDEKDETSAWVYSPAVQWESEETATFFAYSPYSEDINATLSDDALTIAYTASDEDLLFAAETQSYADGSIVKLDFAHALSAVGFSIKGDSEMQVWVNSISIGEVYTSATATVTSSGFEWDSRDSETGELAVGLIDDPATSKTSSEYINITADDGYLTAIPQPLGDTSYIEVEYIVEGSSNIKKVYFLLKGEEWEPAKVYTYKLDFSGVTPDEELSSDNITFTVSVSDWVTGETFDNSFIDDALPYEAARCINLNVYNTLEALTQTIEERMDDGIFDFVVYGDYYTHLFGSGMTASDYITALDSCYDEEPDGSSLLLLIYDYVSSPFANYQIKSLDLSRVNMNGVTTLSGLAFSSILEHDLYWIANDYNDDEFDEYSELESIILPDDITELGDMVFLSCMDLESITLENVTSIGMGAFAYCMNLSTIKLPSATYIGSMAFSDIAEGAYVYLTSPDEISTGYESGEHLNCHLILNRVKDSDNYTAYSGGDVYSSSNPTIDTYEGDTYYLWNNLWWRSITFDN